MTPCATSPSRRQGRRGGGEDRSGRSVQNGRRLGPLRDARLIDIHVHVFAGTGEKAPTPATTASTRTASRFARASRPWPTPVRRLAQLRGLQGAHHRPVPDARPRLPQYRRQRHARREVRAGPGDMEAKPAAEMARDIRADRRHQDGALRRPGMDARGARGGGGDDREHSGHGGLRREQARAADRGL